MLMKKATLAVLLFLPMLIEARDPMPKRAQITVGLGYLVLGEQQARFTHIPFQRLPYEVLTPKVTRDYLTGHFHFRINLKAWEAKKQSLSLGFPVTLAFLAEASFGSGGVPQENRNFLIAQLPFLVEYAIGQKAFFGAAAKSGLGGFIGAGGSLTTSSGKTGEFSTVAPHGVIGVRKNFGGKWTWELSCSANLLPQIVDTHQTLENFDGASQSDISSFFNPEIKSASVNLSVYFK